MPRPNNCVTHTLCRLPPWSPRVTKGTSGSRPCCNRSAKRSARQIRNRPWHLPIDALALADSPDFRRTAITYRAISYIELGRFAEAEADCQQAIAMDSSYADQLPALAGTRDHHLTELEDLSLLWQPGQHMGVREYLRGRKRTECAG